MTTETLLLPSIVDMEEDWSLIEHVVTEDDTPVDSLYAAKQQRLLVETLYSSWVREEGNHLFLADANVGVFYAFQKPPLVPDVFLSLEVKAAKDMQKKENRSYFIRVFGKPPDVVIELVSNTYGGEDSDKLDLYARMGVPYYVIYDPEEHLDRGVLRSFERHDDHYVEVAQPWFPAVGLGVTQWYGWYEGAWAEWLRWYDRDGNLLLTGAERIEQEQRERARAEAHLEQERQRAERLIAQLRALGIEPEG